VKDYYNILRVSRTASASEIKRSYRLLAQRYHPDVNKDISAAELIKEINEAYDVLGDAAKKRKYDGGMFNPYETVQAQQASRYRDPSYKKPFRATPKINPQLELMKNYMIYAVGTGWAGCIMCFFLLLDLAIPHHVSSETITKFSSTGTRVVTPIVITNAGHRIKVSGEDRHYFGTGQKIEVIEAAITGIIITIYIPENGYRVTSLATLYRNFSFVPVLLLIASVLCVTLKNRIEVRFNCGIVTFFLLIFTIILLVK
jgi:hypothetical protein